MRIGEDKIQEIRSAADIVEVIGGFVRLKKAGRSFAGLCPFHKEKTPSFHVNPERATYKCFGCGKGGDVFTFLIETKKVTFIEAVEELAERYHISLPRDSSIAPEVEMQKDRLFGVMRKATEYYYTLLRAPEGEGGWRYAKGRKWGPEVLHRFGVGYAPDSWDALASLAKRDAWDMDALIEAGVLGVNEAGRQYDRFRHRLVFPIILPGKKVAGFGGRSIRAEDTPKYLNSPESPIYVKSRTLYGLTQAATEIRRIGSVIVVEGYADVLSLNQAGVTNVVATCGTALTPDHVRTLKRYSRQVFFLYDADEAGQRAMMRGIESMVEQGFDPKIVVLPTGEDPDSFVRNQGADALRRACDQAQSFVDYIAARMGATGQSEGPEGGTDTVRHLVSLLARMDDPLRREMYIRHLAGTWSIAESTLYSELAKQAQMNPRPILPVSEEEDEAPIEQPRLNVALPRMEMSLVQAILHAPDSVRLAALRRIRVDKIRDPRLRVLLAILVEELENTGNCDTDLLRSRVEDREEVVAALEEVLQPVTAISPRWREVQVVKKTDMDAVVLDAWRKVLMDDTMRMHEVLQKHLKYTPTDSPEYDAILSACAKLVRARQDMLEARNYDALEQCDHQADSAAAAIL